MLKLKTLTSGNELLMKNVKRRSFNAQKVKQLIEKVQALKEIAREEEREKLLVTKKYQAAGERRHIQTLYAKKRMASFTPDFPWIADR